MMEVSCFSGSFAAAERHLAMISPWLRWEPKMKSSTPSVQALAHHGRLLSDGQVRGPQVVVGDPLVGALRLDGVEHGLELADHDHVAVHPDKGFPAVLLGFLLHVRGIRVQRDVAERELARFSRFTRVNDD